ncbi:MAG: four helix bundle protein [Sandaracinaceae bacterium]
MLRITEEAIVWLRSIKPIWKAVAKHDKNLARQLRDSAASVVGNLAEGEQRGGGHERERFGTDYGSADETRVWLLAAAALGYVSDEAVEGPADSDKARATMWKLMPSRVGVAGWLRLRSESPRLSSAQTRRLDAVLLMATPASESASCSACDS